MKRLSSRARRTVAALALLSVGVGGAAGTGLVLGGHDHIVASPHFACVGAWNLGVCIGPPGS
ncbi:MAG TPA: hypothetical protein VFH50_08650 [Acidimicrobiales bacterium]|nr:hypothetical protein [Acidimicrobiales bacterium]